MNNIQWNIKTFQELRVEQLFEVLQLRVNVFVVEQQCAYPELDDYDRHPETRHLSGRNDVGELITYARLLPSGLRYAEVNLGRFVVKAEWRKKGIGHQKFLAVGLAMPLEFPHKTIYKRSMRSMGLSEYRMSIWKMGFLILRW